MKSVVRFFLFCGVFSSSLAFAKKSDWNLSVEPLFGVRTGEIGEYVFKRNSAYRSDTLSELTWETKPEVYFGANVSGGWKKIFGEVSFTGALPASCGQMLDSDWLNVQYPGYPSYQYKTNYSESDNTLDHDFSVGLKLGYRLDVFASKAVALSVRPFASFEYSNIEMLASGGTYWYGKAMASGLYSAFDSGSVSTGKLSGDAVSYSRQTFLLWFGFDAALRFPKKITLSFSFQISPYTYAQSLDKHYLNNPAYGGTAYLDVSSGSFTSIRAGAGLSYDITKRSAIRFSFAYTYIGQIRGDAYAKTMKAYDADSTFYSNEKNASVEGGADAYSFDFSLGWKFKIL